MRFDGYNSLLFSWDTNLNGPMIICQAHYMSKKDDSTLNFDSKFYDMH